MKDYTVTVKDNQGQIAVLAISGDSVIEGLATGISLGEVCEQLETSAFWKAVQAGEISEKAFMVDSTDHPLH